MALISYLNLFFSPWFVGRSGIQLVLFLLYILSIVLLRKKFLRIIKPQKHILVPVVLAIFVIQAYQQVIYSTRAGTALFGYSSPVIEGIESTNTFSHSHTVKSFGAYLTKLFISSNTTLNADFGDPMLEFIPVPLIIVTGFLSVLAAGIILLCAINNISNCKQINFNYITLVIVNSLTSFGLVKLLFDGGWWNAKALGLFIAFFMLSRLHLEDDTQGNLFVRLARSKLFLAGIFLVVCSKIALEYDQIITFTTLSDYLSAPITNLVILTFFSKKIFTNGTSLILSSVIVILYVVYVMYSHPLETLFWLKSKSENKIAHVIEPKTKKGLFPSVNKYNFKDSFDLIRFLNQLGINPSFAGWLVADSSCSSQVPSRWALEINLIEGKIVDSPYLGEYVTELRVIKSDTGQQAYNPHRIELRTSKCLPPEIGQPTYIYRVLAYNGLSKFVVRNIWKW